MRELVKTEEFSFNDCMGNCAVYAVNNVGQKHSSCPYTVPSDHLNKVIFKRQTFISYAREE
jgi:hypothetical protein